MPDPIVRLGLGASGPEPRGAASWRTRAESELGVSAAEVERLAGAVSAVPVVATIGWVVFGVAVALALLILAAAVSAVGLVRRRAHRRRMLLRAAPDALEAIARDLRTGHSFRSAIARQAETGAALAAPFRRVRAAIELGRPADSACAVFAEHADANFPGATMAALLATASHGGRGSSQALDIGAAALRHRALLRSEVRSLVAQAESSVRVLASLPVAFIALGFATGQSGSLALFTTTTGRWCLGLGLAMNLVGLGWMRHLVRSVSV